MFNPTWLNTFRVLIETKHFTKTAERLAMTQPGVSQHIQKLEEHYGVSLIKRMGKRFELTFKGRLVYEYAVKFFHEHEVLERSLHEDPPFEGDCRLSSPGSLGLALYPFLIRYQQQHPGIRVHYAFAPNLSIERDVLAGKSDLGFVTEKPETGELDFQLFAQEQLCLMVPAAFEFPDFEALQQLGFINHPDGKYHASLLLQPNFPDKFHSFNQLPLQGFINQISMILDPVALGLGFTVLPEYAVRRYQQRDQVRCVDLPLAVYESIYMIRKRHIELPQRYAHLIGAYQQHLELTD